MSLIVQKYGGSSVGTPDRILNVARRILQAQRTGNQVVAVVSAMSGVTDNLIKLAGQVAPQPTEREMDVLLATGEQTTIALTAMAINGLGGRAVSLTGAQAGIVTDGVHTKAKIANITPRRIHTFLDAWEFRHGPGNAFPGNGKQRWPEGRIAELERKIGQQTVEIDFLKGCLQRIEEQRMLQALTGNPRSTGRSKKK
jgi:hypothetical protein